MGKLSTILNEIPLLFISVYYTDTIGREVALFVCLSYRIYRFL